jgi:hypothetical protein
MLAPLFRHTCKLASPLQVGISKINLGEDTCVVYTEELIADSAAEMFLSSFLLTWDGSSSKEQKYWH